MPIIYEVLKWHNELYLPFVQGIAAMFYIPILIFIMGFRGLSFIIKINMSEKRKGISEGIFISVITWQVILFFTGYSDALIPGFNTALHHAREIITNSTT